MTKSEGREQAQVVLLREAAGGHLRRRAVLRRGLALGVGLPALIGVVIAARPDHAAARTSGAITCSSSDRFFCHRGCNQRMVTCRQIYPDSLCVPAYNACLNGCDACELPTDIA